MIEARIECQCNKILLPDLKASLVRDDVIYIDDTTARKSADLQRAWKARAVTVKYVERCQQRRPVGPVMPINQGMVAAPTAAPATGDHLLVDPDAIAARVEVVVTRQIKALEDRLVAQMEALVARVGPSAGLLSQTVTASPAQDHSVDDHVPVFIPSRIDDKGLNADLGIEAKDEGQESVSEAAAALRAARKMSQK